MNVDSVIDVPCFKCLLNKEVVEYYCVPANCEKLEKWLALFDVTVLCPRCKTINSVVRNKNVATQLFKCRGCGARFREWFV